MKTEKSYRLEILERGIIQLMISTIYFKDNGEELTRENWRTVFTPNDLDKAKELLNDYYLNIVKSVWTKEVVDEYNGVVDECDKCGNSHH